jgi:hypothetical protein
VRSLLRLRAAPTVTVATIAAIAATALAALGRVAAGAGTPALWTCHQTPP